MCARTLEGIQVLNIQPLGLSSMDTINSHNIPFRVEGVWKRSLMRVCVTNYVLLLQTGDVAYFSSETPQRRPRSKLHKATWIGINGGLTIYFSRDIPDGSGCMDVFFAERKITALGYGIMVKIKCIYDNIYVYLYLQHQQGRGSRFDALKV